MYRQTSILYRIADSFFRHRWLFLIALVVVTSVTMTALYLRSRTFTAGALTQVVTEDVATELGVSQNNSWISLAQQNVNHFNDLINNDLPGGFLDTALNGEVQDKLTGKILPPLSKPIVIDPDTSDERYTMLRKHLSASAQSDTLFSINLIWDNPEECALIVKRLENHYIEEVGYEKSTQSTATTAFLDQQIKIYQNQLLAKEQVLADYKSKNLGELPESQSADISQLSNLKAQLDNMLITAHDASLRRAALVKRLAQVPATSTLEQTASQSPLEREINALKAKRDVLLADRLPTHPDVVALDGRIAELVKVQMRGVRAGAPESKNLIQRKTQDNPEYQYLQQQLTDANISEQTQNAQIAHLKQTIAQYEARVQNIPDAQRDLYHKTRDYNIVKTRLESLLAKQDEMKMKAALASVAAKSTLSLAARIYAMPTTGKTKMAVMFIGSIILGFLVGIILVVLSEWADHSLRYNADTERLLGVPVLAMLPETADLRFLPPPSSGKGRGGRRTLSAPNEKKAKAALAAPAKAAAVNASAQDA